MIMKRRHKYVKHELQQYHLQLIGMSCWRAHARARVFPFRVPNSKNAFLLHKQTRINGYDFTRTCDQTG